MSSTTVLAGKKRKRYTPVEKDVSVKLTGKLHHGFKEIRKSVKKAKTFETQKLVKKLKGLRKPAPGVDVVTRDINDIEDELEYLKKVDQERIAQLALSSKIRKDKILSSHEAFKSVLPSATPSSTSLEAHAKVESRLLSSKFLAGEVDSVLNGLKAILDPRPKGELAGDSVESAKEMEDQAEDEMNVGFEDEPGGHGTITHTDDEKSLGGLDEMLEEADDLVDDDGWESGSVNPGDASDGQEDGSLSSIFTHKRLKTDPDLRAQAATLDIGSQFLPSLSVGFVRGAPGSDIDESDGDDAKAGRKNRRGQKARQAIWEKKYGKNAKHVKKQREEAKAVITAKQLGKRPDSGWNGRQSLSHKPSGSAKGSRPGVREVERPTHPSWEAKKKLKEKESAKILPSQGKKIIFG